LINLFCEDYPAFEESMEKIVSLCEKDCIGLKAIGPLLSYGVKYDRIAMFWVQEVNGEINSFISKCYNDTVAYLSNGADVFEVASFLKVIGYFSLTTNSQELIDKLTYKESPEEVSNVAPSGHIMKLPKGNEYKGKVASLDGKIFVNREEDFNIFYETLNNNFPGNVFSNYSDWYVDISHRVRHGTMDFAIVLDFDCKATASALIISEGSALLGAISTNEEVRGKHYAQTLIGMFCEKYKDKDIFIMCAPEKVAFYEKQGFENTSVFYSI